MVEKNNLNLLIRFIKEENIYKTVINSIKYYGQRCKNDIDISIRIYNASNNGKFAYNLFEWVFALHRNMMLEKKKETYFCNNYARKLGLSYTKKWEKYLKKYGRK